MNAPEDYASSSDIERFKLEHPDDWEQLLAVPDDLWKEDEMVEYKEQQGVYIAVTLQEAEFLNVVLDAFVKEPETPGIKAAVRLAIETAKKEEADA